jgi:Outer membrane protein beta-barrel domain
VIVPSKFDAHCVYKNPKSHIMKKVIICVAVALASVSAYAQKQTGGEKNLELTFTPFSGTPISMNGIRFRMFNSENTAIRFSLYAGGSKTQDIKDQPTANAIDPTVTSPELLSITGKKEIGLSVGYEKHFAGTDRLSPYVGGQVTFTTGSTKEESQFWGAVATEDLGSPTKWGTWSMVKTSKHTMFGLGAVAGFDYYIADNLYLGAECGFGIGMTKQKDLEFSVDESYFKLDGTAQGDSFNSATGVPAIAQLDANGNVKYNTVIGDGKGNWKASNWGTNVQGTIRLGWLFNN